MNQCIIAVLGWSNTGKTTFIEQGIAECTKRGIHTAAIKKSKQDPDFPAVGKDSARYLLAGADQVLFISDHAYVLDSKDASSGLKPLPVPASHAVEAWALSMVQNAEVVFCEGLKADSALKVLTCGSAQSETELKFPIQDIDILITSSVQLAESARMRGKKVFTPAAAAACIESILQKGDEP